MTEQFKKVTLGELLEESDFKKVEGLIRFRKWEELRKFLNSIKDKLEKRGIVADYLFYCLKYQFDN